MKSYHGYFLLQRDSLSLSHSDDTRLPSDDQILKMIKVHKREVKPAIHTPDEIMLNQVPNIAISECYEGYANTIVYHTTD